ncbi:MAG: sugar ABC transporter ATP-binding protein [Ectothiorhodospiraceae bacterium AqS1]|nr:sugar ABC transporter ATP-binding protein [Ectothiorhodospiraceae bacterium AqS1]
MGAKGLCGGGRQGSGGSRRDSIRPHAALDLHRGGVDLRLGRLGGDRAFGLGQPAEFLRRQPRCHHRGGHRGLLAFRRPRLDFGHPHRGPDRRRLPIRSQDRRGRRAVAGIHGRGFDHRRGGDGSVDTQGIGVSLPVLQAKGLVKRYGHVVAMDDCDFELEAGEILAVIGDNGAGKSTLIKALSGAVIPDAGEILLDGRPVAFGSPIEARRAGIETVYQNLALLPALSIVDNMFLGREIRSPGFVGKWLRRLDREEMRRVARKNLTELGLLTIQDIDQAVETLSGGQRQGVAVVRAVAFGSKVVIMDEPTAALGVREGRRVLDLIREVRDRGLPIVLISHNMPHVFEVADRIHVHRLGRRIAILDPAEVDMSAAVAIMTGAIEPPPQQPQRQQALPA